MTGNNAYICTSKKKKYVGQEIKTEKDISVKAIFARGKER